MFYILHKQTREIQCPCTLYYLSAPAPATLIF